MNLRLVEFIISLITQCIAYIIAETTCGYVRTWVAAKMGDDTAQEAGYQTLNPLIHIDILGFIFLIIYGFGWGKYIPINPYRIHAPYRALKVGLAYFSDTIVHIVIALVGLLSLVRVFGVTILNVARPMIVYRQIALNILEQYYPDSSSLLLSVGMILVTLIYLCVLLAVLHFLVNCVRLGLFLWDAQSPFNLYIEFIVPVILIICCAEKLGNIVINSIVTIAYTIAPFIGGVA